MAIALILIVIGLLVTAVIRTRQGFLDHEVRAGETVALWTGERHLKVIVIARLNAGEALVRLPMGTNIVVKVERLYPW